MLATLATQRGQRHRDKQDKQALLTVIPLLCGRARRDAVKSLKIYNVDDGIHGLLEATALRGYGVRYPVPSSSTNAGRGGAASATRGRPASPRTETGKIEFLYSEVEIDTSKSLLVRDAVCKNKLLLFKLSKILS